MGVSWGDEEPSLNRDDVSMVTELCGSNGAGILSTSCLTCRDVGVNILGTEMTTNYRIDIQVYIMHMTLFITCKSYQHKASAFDLVKVIEIPDLRQEQRQIFYTHI